MTPSDILAALRAVSRGETVSWWDLDRLRGRHLVTMVTLTNTDRMPARQVVELTNTGRAFLTLADERDAAVTALDVARLRSAYWKANTTASDRRYDATSINGFEPEDGAQERLLEAITATFEAEKTLRDAGGEP